MVRDKDRTFKIPGELLLKIPLKELQERVRLRLFYLHPQH